MLPHVGQSERSVLYFVKQTTPAGAQYLTSHEFKSRPQFLDLLGFLRRGHPGYTFIEAPRQCIQRLFPDKIRDKMFEVWPKTT